MVSPKQMLARGKSDHLQIVTWKIYKTLLLVERQKPYKKVAPRSDLEFVTEVCRRLVNFENLETKYMYYKIGGLHKYKTL